MKYYLIYKITNTLNNKIYVGAHVTENKNDSYMGSGSYLRRAQKKYGLDKFKKEILFECKSADEMFKREAEIVDEEFVARLDTYNLKVGGDGGWDFCNATGKRVSIENQKCDIKARTEKAQQTKENWSDEKRNAIRQKFSAAAKLYFEIHGHNWLGRNHSEMTKQKMHEAHIGKHVGKKNSNYGKMWICNDETHESKSIPKSDPIPKGWRKGRFCNK